MRILPTADDIFRMGAAPHEPWFPEPTPGPYDTDADWQKQHLWDHFTETGNTFGPYRGPSILHHPDLQYALDNGWRVYGNPKTIDHQTRGETGSGTRYLYKISPENGFVHSIHLSFGPQDANGLGEGVPGDEFDQRYGTVPEDNYRHLIEAEGGPMEGPVQHETLRDLVDDEQRRSQDPEGYKDFTALPGYRQKRDPSQLKWDQRYQHATRRAWETGTNDHSKHWDDPIPDPYADIDKIPKGQRPTSDQLGDDFGGARHPRYGSESS